VIARILTGCQIACEIVFDCRSGIGFCCSDHHTYAFLSEQILSSPSHSARDYDLGPLLLEPTREGTRFVGRRRKKAAALDQPILCFEHGELLAVPEVGGQASSRNWNSYRHCASPSVSFDFLRDSVAVSAGLSAEAPARASATFSNTAVQAESVTATTIGQPSSPARLPLDRRAETRGTALPFRVTALPRLSPKGSTDFPQ
jgi:hypothetical protein